MQIRDRIKELRRVKAAELRPNPRNWRTHPQAQQDALRGILAEVGYAEALVARELPDGSLELIDGHLRAETTPEQEVPVLVLDVTEAEANKLLATLDPLAAMAESNAVNLDSLLREVDTGSEALAQMLSELAEEAGAIPLDDAGVIPSEDAGDSEEADDTYSRKITAPVYEPKGECPTVADLVDHEKTSRLVAEINSADIPADVAGFLRQAAERHTVYNYRQIAEFYCHASAQVQDLMERSGLVIIDFNKAIEYGFVHMTEKLGAIADLEAFSEAAGCA